MLFTWHRRRNGQKYGYNDSWAMAIGLAGCSQTWKEYDLKIGDKKIGERGMWIGLSEKANKYEGLCVLCECSPKGVLSRGRF